MTSPCSSHTSEKSREVAAVLFRQAATMKQTVLAEIMECSDSTVSRRLNEDIDKLARLLVSLGLYPVPESSVITDPSEFKALKTLAFKYLESTQKAEGV